MYSKIMVPVDLAHTERLDKAITTAIDIARMYSIPVCMEGVRHSLDARCSVIAQPGPAEARILQ